MEVLWERVVAVMVEVAPPSLCEGGASKRSGASGGMLGDVRGAGCCGRGLAHPLRVHPLRNSLRSFASPSLREGEDSLPPPFVPHFRRFPLTRNRLLISPWEGAVHNLTYDGFTVRSRAPSPCPAPLDSGFRRNDGDCAQPLGRGRGTAPPSHRTVAASSSRAKFSNCWQHRCVLWQGCARIRNTRDWN